MSFIVVQPSGASERTKNTAALRETRMQTRKLHTRLNCIGAIGVLAFLMSFATNAAAQSTVNRGWPVNADAAVKVFGDAGSMKIIGWDRDSVDITGTVAATGSVFGGGSRLGVKFGIETTPGKTALPSDVVVHVPARARVWLRSASADIEVSVFAGALDISTVGGRVRVSGTPMEVRAETMNGSLDMNGSPAYLRLKTATGNITWTGSSDDVGITTVSGRVVINAGTVQRARFESIDGEIRYTGGLTRSAGVTIDTHSGNVVLAFRKGTNTVLQVNAPGCELFGIKEGAPRGKNSMPPKTFAQDVGESSFGGPSFVVRTYKGFVSAVMQ